MGKAVHCPKMFDGASVKASGSGRLFHCAQKHFTFAV
jgi:hypothetical protein